MKIAFVLQSISMDGDVLENRGIGGTETAMIRTARELAKIGNDVLCFVSTETEHTSHAVHYVPIQKLKSYNDTHDGFDVLISIRHWQALILPIKAKLRVYFSPDSYDQPFLKSVYPFEASVNDVVCPVDFYSPLEAMPNVDAIFCVSKWQAKQFVQRLNFPFEKIVVTSNGVDLSLFQPLPFEARRQSLIYSSTPFRGLKFLPPFYSFLKQDFPKLALDVASSMKVYGGNDESYHSLFEELKSVGANLLGTISQKDLANRLCSSKIFVYPNIFEETFCIAVLEAQAAGLPVVCSERAALSERIQNGINGFLIPGEPGTPEYDNRFIASVTALLTHDELWNKMSLAALKTAEHFTYEHIAKTWMDYFNNALLGREFKIPEFRPEITSWETRLTKENLIQKCHFEADYLKEVIKQHHEVYGFGRD